MNLYQNTLYLIDFFVFFCKKGIIMLNKEKNEKNRPNVIWRHCLNPSAVFNFFGGKFIFSVYVLIHRIILLK